MILILIAAGLEITITNKITVTNQGLTKENEKEERERIVA